MIERLVNVLVDAGFDLTYDQIADALWLAKFLPKPRIPSGITEPPPHAMAQGEPPSAAAKSSVSETRPAGTAPKRSTAAANPDSAPGELFVPSPKSSES